MDYPAGQVRWTEGRNFEAVLDLLAAGRLKVADLVTHTFDIAEAPRRLPADRGARRAVPGHPAQLPAAGRRASPADDAPAAGAGRGRGPPRGAARRRRAPGVGWIGAGAFSTGTLLPAFQAAGFGRFAAVASASGVARDACRGAARLRPGGVRRRSAVIDDPDTDVVVIATPHDTHAELAVLALQGGRHVWCEKPLALTLDELEQVRAAWQGSGRELAIGFNRRWSPAVLAARQAARRRSPAPKLLVYRVAAGPVPDGHWYHDRRQGGRLLGEVCHFVDTAQALIGAPIEEAAGLAGGGGEPGDDAVVSLRFADGSLATIAYGSVRPGGRQGVDRGDAAARAGSSSTTSARA